MKGSATFAYESVRTAPQHARTDSWSPTATGADVIKLGFGSERRADMASAFQFEHGLGVAEAGVVGFFAQEGLLVEFQWVGVSWTPGVWVRSWSHSTM